MAKIFLRSLIIISLLAIFSCESDETYDKEKAIDAFAKQDLLKVDSDMGLVGITIPNMKDNDSWISSSSSKNTTNHNIFKEFKINKKSKIILKTNNKYWHLYSGNRASRYFFKPLIVNDTAFSLDSSGILRAINLNNEKLLLKKRLFPRKLLSSYQMPKISYEDEIIYAIAGSNKIVAFNVKNKEIIWSKNISSIPIAAPLVRGDDLFILTNDNKIYALNKNDSELKWVQSAIFRPTTIFGAADLIIKDDNLFASFSSGEIYALNKNNGEILWSNSLNISRAINSDFYLNDIDATPVIDKNIIYAIGNGGLMMAINIEDGEYLWKKDLASITNFWLAGNYIYLITNDNKLITIHKKFGKIKRIIQLPDFKKKDKPKTKFIYNGITMAGSKLVISSANGKVMILDPLNGEILQEIKIAKKLYHEPIIVNDKIYFYAIDNYLAKLIEVK